LDGVQRDAATRSTLLAGNIPEFLWRLQPVTLQAELNTGKMVSVTVCVSPDYLAVGSNEDFVRVPLGLRAAVDVSEQLGFMLPTTKIVDAIYAQAGIRVQPQPMEPGSDMRSTPYFVRHDRLIRNQTAEKGAILGRLVAGQKKDIVITNRLLDHPGRVAIYGWHRNNGTPIQPLSTVHGENYADYSHGVRLVSNIAYVNGKEHPLRDILQDAQLATAVSYEGPIRNLRALMASLFSR